MTSDVNIPEIEIAGVTKRYGSDRAVLESIDLLSEACHSFDEQRELFHDTAARVYRLPR